MTSKDRAAAQTGSEQGDYKQGDKHPELPGIRFWRYMHGREYWVGPEQFAKNQAKAREASAKRSRSPGDLVKKCETCGEQFTTKLRTKLYCGEMCRPTRPARRYHSSVGLGLGEFGDEF